MNRESIEIVPCPPALCIEALALVLTDLTPQQRREIAPTLPGRAVEALVVALEHGELCGAAWGQRQPGNTAILWPPQGPSTADPVIATSLVCAAVAALDAVGIRMVQVLMSDHQVPLVRVIESAGFQQLSQLLYLNWETIAPADSPSELEFDGFHEADHDRLASVIEATYVATRDCVGLDGRRPMDEVLAGYRATGTFRPENWLIARRGNEDVGVLLLAEHGAANQWELLYMGVVPAARGHRFGRDIVRHAQRRALAAGIERIVLAVDAENTPAIKMYNDTGFTAWDRRTVYVRFEDGDSHAVKTP